MAKKIVGIKFYDENEVAELLGVTRRTVQTYRWTGGLQAKRIGRSWYISEENLRRFLEGREQVEREDK